ncbi:hypothetical protein SARC_14054 [Sphaeroforma arctica JP610]|uniref:Uncharacterized protein n=1 Tax=Sphaeroforma arctica JP610 TaxID=667725 RepID=A0A0L0F9J1_9EUKA|nr:hypothetical protein SARC_14054 [Sphaeroforma arctica JP610]KNC73385.1 hypothetical protein SARC_14054 [Sphaeroforma arctica JP610]|eukprot:XP_014147287.1 hypothetical protein SARC_14054 [Sphaeroforma arctica JP610]
MLKCSTYQRRSPRQPCLPGADDKGTTLTNPYVAPPDTTKPSPDITSAIRPDDVLKVILFYPSMDPGPDGIQILLLKATVERFAKRRTL